jgi:dipeptidyl aminopeptidase/acylaminoacyl peptidase
MMYYPNWAPDGKRLAFPYSPHDYIAPCRTVCGVVLPSGGKVECFATEYFIHSGIRWHPDGRTLSCIGNRGIGTQVLRVDTVTGNVQPLTCEPGLHYAPSLSSDGKWLACLYTSPTTLPEVYLLSTDGRERRRLTCVNDQLERFQLAETEIVHWKAPDGLELGGLLVKPLDFQPGRRYPTIVDLHGGPFGGEWLCFHPDWHWLAATGYLVFMPEFRGSQLYGWCEPPTEPHDVEDVLSGVDWLVEAGYADPDRLGVRGHSYGATLALWVISHTRRFRAAVVDGIDRGHAEVSYGVEFGGGGNPLVERLLGGKPWEVPEAYRRYSTLTYIPNARTPTLILQGEYDHLMYSQMVYTWLRQSGAEVEFIKYLGEGHVISKREHRADFWRRTLAWFDRHLRQ